jgi:hypothetical protein
MSGPYTIDAEALYDDATLCRTIGLKINSLDRARKNGELRYTKRGGRVLYLGAWVHDWLTRETAGPGGGPCATQAPPPSAGSCPRQSTESLLAISGLPTPSAAEPAGQGVAQ